MFVYQRRWPACRFLGARTYATSTELSSIRVKVIHPLHQCWVHLCDKYEPFPDWKLKVLQYVELSDALESSFLILWVVVHGRS